MSKIAERKNHKVNVPAVGNTQEVENILGAAQEEAGFEYALISDRGDARDLRRDVEEIEPAQWTTYTHVCLHQVGPVQKASSTSARGRFCRALADRVTSRPSRARADREAAPGDDDDATLRQVSDR